MKNPLSSFQREENLQQLKCENFDVLVIGGGITGAGIALDAASRGLKTALIEKNDFAWGTSSRSTKLIHGGLRYLKQMEVKLVREVGSERAVVHRNAPHLVIPEKMLLPLIKGGNYGKLSTSWGLWLYDQLAGVTSEDRKKMLTKEEVSRLEPLFEKDNLTGGAIYAEYRTDDARLTIEVLKTAVQHGALAINYMHAEQFLYNDQYISGVKARDMFSQETTDISAKIVINAAGPWVDELRKKDSTIRNKSLRHSKGVHLVVKREKFPIKQAIYFDVPDGRMLFAIPRGKVTYFGTTDTDYFETIDHPKTTIKDVHYLLNAVNTMFPTLELKPHDIISSWAGLRPLIHASGKAPHELSRRDEIFISPNGLISIAGGKLTGYRKMAQRAVYLACNILTRRFNMIKKPSKTRFMQLSGGDFENHQAVENYIGELTHELHAYGLSHEHAVYLVRNYGSNSPVLIKKFREYKENSPLHSFVKAEIWYQIHHESVHTLCDYFIRRTGRLYFDPESVERLKNFALDAFTLFFKWDEKRRQHELQELDNSVLDSKVFMEMAQEKA